MIQIQNISRLSCQLVITTGVAFFTLALSGCNSNKGPKNLADQEAHEEISYAALRVNTSQPVRELNLPGELESFYETDLFPRVSSYISKMHVDIGDQVSKGQVLAELEAPELIANLTAAYSKVKAAEAVFGASKAAFRRAMKTRQTPGAISEMDVDAARTKVISDSLTVVAEEAHYQSVKQLADYLKIVAPFAGMVTDRRLSPGAFVGPGGQNALPILKIRQLDRLRLRLAVPEAYLGDIKVGTDVRFSVSTFRSENFTGKIARVSNSVRPDTRSEMIEIDISNPKRRLKPGMFVSAKLPVTAVEGSIYVPQSAVVSNLERTFVIKVEQGRARWVDVQKGDATAGQVQIFGNIAQGDTILRAASEDISMDEPIKIDLSAMNP
jgi:membrane fusion protein (multidrug efflux system)